MTREHIEIVIAAAKKFQFRTPNPEEDPVNYITELYHFVQKRDWASAHEIRVGRLQNDWIPEDVQSFSEFIRGIKGLPKDEFPPGVTSFPIFDGEEKYEASDAGLLALASYEMNVFMEFRKNFKEDNPPVIIHILDMYGNVCSAITNPKNRIAVAKYLVQTKSAIGYVVLVDTFMHTIDELTHKTAKLDVLLGHIGSRSLSIRRTLYRVYTIQNDEIIYDNGDLPLERDWQIVKERMSDDPYASIFAMPLKNQNPS